MIPSLSGPQDAAVKKGLIVSHNGDSCPEIAAVSLTSTTMLKRFGSYLTGDGLNYLLGLAIYLFLIQVLSDQQYGEISVGINIYQIFVMFVALGLDLFGTRIIVSRGADLSKIVARVQLLRIGVAFLICAPIMAIAALHYLRIGESIIAVVILGGFTMVLARAFDLNYVAVALSEPVILVRTRVLGLSLYLASLVIFQANIVKHLWIIPVLNAAGITIGRIRMMQLLRPKYQTPDESVENSSLPSFQYLIEAGFKSSGGQLLLLAMCSLDVILLHRYISMQELGQYAMMSRMYLFGTAVLTALLNTFLPELMLAAENHRGFTIQFKRFWIFSCILGLIGLLAFWTLAPFIFETITHRPLITARELGPLYGIVFALMAICNPFLSLLPGLKLESHYLLSICSAVVTVLAVDVILVPKMGATGAAYGQICGTAMLLLSTALSLRSYIQHLEIKSGLKTPLTTAIL